MSLGPCLPGLEADGKLTAEQRQRLGEAYDRHRRRFEQTMAPEAAAAAASEEALREFEFQAALKKRQTALQIKAQTAIDARIKAADDPFAAAIAVLDGHGTTRAINVEAQHKAILGQAHAKLAGVLERHSRNLLGEARDKAGLDDVVRERFGEKTGNAVAAELAEAFGAASDFVRDRFNQAGGAIARRADWGMPQAHDMAKVRAVPFEQWRDKVLPRLDLTRMIDDATGAPFTAETIEQALRDVYENIRSEGWASRSPGQGFAGKLANRRADHRFLIFKTADDWLTYQAEFGTGTPFDAMVGHIDAMARDIALMDVLGPNPDATVRWLTDRVKKDAALSPDPSTSILDRARGAEQTINDVYASVSGKLSTPVNGAVARTFGGVRSFLTSALLGSASLSAITDVAFQAVTRGFVGLPVTGALTGYLRLLNPLNAGDRKVAVRLGLIAEEASRIAASLNRYVDDVHGPEITMRMADAVLRVSGLSAWTQAGRWAFGMEFLGHLADNRGKPLNALDPSLQRVLQTYGIGADSWDRIRASTPLVHKGAEFLRPEDIGDPALADAVLRMVLTETDYAVPTATARARATLSFGQRPGSLGGEIIRNAAMFKSFGVSMLLTHGTRMMQHHTTAGRLQYAAGLTITTTLLGALAIQSKEVSKGRDPKPMDEADFWKQAAFQGGGFGIFGDFVNATENRFGGGFAETLAGPVVSLAKDVSQLEPTDASLVKTLRRYTPGGSIWYLRAAYERVLLDTLAEETDPDYRDAWRRMERRAADNGQGYYWRPGELTPDRLPELNTAPAR